MKTAAMPQEIVEPRGWVSPVGDRPVENPFYLAELRRWRARPLFYSGVAIFATVLIGLTVNERVTAIGPAASSVLTAYLERMFSLMLRPSSIVPAILVWRALYSFREGPFFEPFRTTFMPPKTFVWGVIAVPCMVSVMLVLGYTGAYLAPGILERAEIYKQYPKFEYLQWVVPSSQLVSILIEGASNGLLIAIITAYAGIRYRLAVSGVLLVFAFCVAIQGITVISTPFVEEFRFFLVRSYGADLAKYTLISTLLHYYVWSIPKFYLAWLLWGWTVRDIARGWEP
jgi:hypothetical protein